MHRRAAGRAQGHDWVAATPRHHVDATTPPRRLSLMQGTRAPSTDALTRSDCHCQILRSATQVGSGAYARRCAPTSLGCHTITGLQHDAFALHPTRTQHARNLQTTCSRRATDLQSTCNPSTQTALQTCGRLAVDLRPACTQVVFLHN